MNRITSRILSALAAFLLLAGPVAPAGAGPTEIANLPLLNMTGSGTVKPNLMLLYDNSGSMSSAFTPDYVDDSTTCRSRETMSGGTRGCRIGDPPFASPDFNRQYYDPRVRFAPPVRADGTRTTSATPPRASPPTPITT